MRSAAQPTNWDRKWSPICLPILSLDDRCHQVATAEVQGEPEYRYVTTRHPVAALSPEQVSRRAAELLAPVVAQISLETP
jgi:hypothetical protein